jgi:hypothetical protein
MPVGEPCPSGDFPSGIDGPLLFVREGATGGDGSVASPFGSIQAALDLAAAGTTVVVGRGTYTEGVTVPNQIALVGTCAAETVIAPPIGTPAAVVLEGYRAEIRNLHIRVGAALDIRVAGRSNFIEGVALEGLVEIEHDASATIDGVSIRGSDDPLASGVRSMGELTLQHSVLDGSAIIVRLGEATVRDVAVRRGGFVDLQSDVTLERVAVEGSSQNGIQVTGIGAECTFEDVVVRGSTGAAIIVLEARAIEVRRTRVEDNGGSGINGRHSGTFIVEDVVVRNNGDTGVDLRASESNGELRRALVEGNTKVGVITGFESQMLVEDVVVRGTRPSDDGIPNGIGMQVQNAAGMEVRRALLEDNTVSGLFAAGPDARLDAQDVVMRGTRPFSVSFPGRGVVAQDGALITVTRALVEETRGAGATSLLSGSQLELTDVVFRQIHGGEDGNYGHGIEGYQANATATRILIDGIAGIGVIALGEPTSVALRDTVIRDVTQRDCAEATCIAYPGGMGVGAYTGGVLAMEHFVIERAAVCAVHLAEGEVDLRDGVIAQSGIGACVQVDGYDLSRLRDGVTYVDNTNNLDSTSLPVPDAPSPITGEE